MKVPALKKISGKQVLIIAIAINAILIGVVVAKHLFKAEDDVERKVPAFNIQRICELATLDCYYHNVTEWSKPSDWKGYGAKKLWMEYDGLIRVGIKADQVKISEADNEGVVTIEIPQAVILNKDLDEDSLYEIDSTSPMWGFVPLYSSITTEERREALAMAQEDMVSSASRNGMILNEAQERAKKIIEKNIVTLGEAAGKNYTVQFVDVYGE